MYAAGGGQEYELTRAGPRVAMRAVLAVPPKESCSSRVSLESRYGTCVVPGSAKAAITVCSCERVCACACECVCVCARLCAQCLATQPVRVPMPTLTLPPFPRTLRDMLIAFASDNRVPLLVVRRTRSDPARSTSNNFPRKVLLCRV